FQSIAGMTALRYLTELRMRLAQDWIGTEGRPIGTVAHSLGYGSQAAFSRAFKRTTGRSPGSLRAS
ncbi:helix-turn-helix transcriptional regulator, partial [Thioclava sp. BHET1]